MVKFYVGAFVILVITLIMPLILKFMWNAFLVDIFPVNEIDYIHALGLYVVSQILVKTTVNYGK